MAVNNFINPIGVNTPAYNHTYSPYWQMPQGKNLVQGITPYIGAPYAPVSYPQNYYVTSPFNAPYNTVEAQPVTAPDTQIPIFTPEFEEIYNKYCTLEVLKNYVPVTSSINRDFNKEKAHFYQTYVYAMKLANELKLSTQDKEILKKAAILHDIGKVLVPSEVLNKQGKLNEQERIVVNMHSPLGFEIARNMCFEPEVLKVIQNHHNNNVTDDILTEIVKVADRYDALTSVRPYKNAFPKEQALQILRNEVLEGKINADVYNAFLNCEI